MNPVMPSSLRACSTASHHLLRPLFLNAFLAFDEDFLYTIFPCLLIIKSFLVSPPEVYNRVPFQTCRLLPVWDFLVILFGFFDFFAFFVDLDRDLERRRLTLRLLLRLLERFLLFLLGARGLLAVRRRDLDREDFLLEPRGAAARRRFLEERLLDRDLDREVDIERDRDREAERGLLAVRRFFELRERLLDLEVDAEREELFLGALGAAARRRAFLAFRRDALRFLDFFGARGLLAVRRRDLEREDFFLEPLGAAARRRFFEDRLLDRERERLLDLDAERGLLADRLRDFLFAFLTFRADL